MLTSGHLALALALAIGALLRPVGWVLCALRWRRGMHLTLPALSIHSGQRLGARYARPGWGAYFRERRGRSHTSRCAGPRQRIPLLFDSRIRPQGASLFLHSQLDQFIEAKLRGGRNGCDGKWRVLGAGARSAEAYDDGPTEAAIAKA